MAESKDTTSFFRKVVKFVANPTTEWAELTTPGAEARETEFAKGELKAMIERKRRNDFVRKREFDMLRKMRRSEVMAGQDPAARPSFFQSSMPLTPSSAVKYRVPLTFTSVCWVGSSTSAVPRFSPLRGL